MTVDAIMTDPVLSTGLSKETSPVIDKSMLQSPSEKSIEEPPLQRPECKYVSDQARFHIQERSYTQQYAGLYFSRLCMLRPVILNRAKKLWENSEHANAPHIGRVLDVKRGEICYVIGTVYVDIPLKPNILDEVTQEHWVIAPPPRAKYCSDEDQFMLEDESGRLKLTGDSLRDNMIVTGVIMAVLGCENSDGEFQVLDCCYSEPFERSLPFSPSSHEDYYVALVSDLKIGHESNKLIETELISDYLNGELGGNEDRQFAKNIVRLIVAGNVLDKPKVTEEERKQNKRMNGELQAAALAPTTFLDSFLNSLAPSVPVELMPGDTDPVCASLPQQPIHHALCPRGGKWNSIMFSTNPNSFEIDGISFLGTSGQNISDIYKFVSGEDRLKMAKKTLKWGHLAPTAPDTIWCYPYKDTDPFVLSTVPNVYFIGCQPNFATELLEGPEGQRTRIILIPSFEKTSQIVLVNLKTLNVETISFQCKP